MDDAHRWTVEQVIAVAPSPRAVAAAEPLATTARWSALGGDDRAVWGRCHGSGAEPYDTAVDHVAVAWQCTCPSRRRPCKHVLALLLLWVAGGVPPAPRPEPVVEWVARRDRRGAGDDRNEHGSGGSGGGADRGADGGSPSDDAGRDDAGRDDAGRDDAGRDDAGRDDAAGPDRDEPGRDELDRARDERVARMREGLRELDRWLEDRMRTGLADPALARYSTWDGLAARLVDARAGALANRVRRLAGLVGASPEWHADVLAEIGLLHLVAQAGRRLPELPGRLADAVAVASGWQVRQADVLAGVPDTDEWFVAGRSDTREDRIEVRRVWLRGLRSGRWAMVLSFAAYQQPIDDSFTVGTVLHADLHRYPGRSLRALAGRRLADPLPLARPPVGSIAEACDEIGTAVAAEPWLEYVPAIVRATPSVLAGRWVLADDTGSLPISADGHALAVVVAAAAGDALDLTIEWTPRGVRPVTVHLPDRALDVGPRADPTFVGVA